MAAYRDAVLAEKDLGVMVAAPAGITKAQGNGKGWLRTLYSDGRAFTSHSRPAATRSSVQCSESRERWACACVQLTVEHYPATDREPMIRQVEPRSKVRRSSCKRRVVPGRRPAASFGADCLAGMWRSVQPVGNQMWLTAG